MKPTIRERLIENLGKMSQLHPRDTHSTPAMNSDLGGRDPKTYYNSATLAYLGDSVVVHEISDWIPPIKILNLSNLIEGMGIASSPSLPSKALKPAELPNEGARGSDSTPPPFYPSNYFFSDLSSPPLPPLSLSLFITTPSCSFSAVFVCIYVYAWSASNSSLSYYFVQC